MRKYIENIVWGIFVSFLMISCVSIFVSDLFHFGRVERINNIYKNDTIHFVIMLIILFLGYLLTSRLFQKCSKQGYWRFIFVGSLLLLALQLIIVYCIWFQTGWDITSVYWDAVHRAEEGILLGSHQYFVKNPNNAFLCAIFAHIDRVLYVTGIKHYYMVLCCIGALLLNLTGILLAYVCDRLHMGYPKAGYTWIVYTLFTGLSPWMCVPYSDIYAIVFPMAILAFYLTETRKCLTSFFKWMGMGFCALFGYYIKPTAVIILIAIFVVTILKEKEKKSWKQQMKRLCVALCGLLLGMGVVVGIHRYAIDYMGLIENREQEVVWSHFLMMGQNEEHLGAYCFADVEYTHSFPTRDEKIQANLQEFSSRVKNRGFWGNVCFYTKKNLNTYDDGTFAWGAESADFYLDMHERTDAPSVFLRNIFYSDGKYYDGYSSFCQGVWITLLIGCCLILFSKERERYFPIAIAILGISLFILFFERKSRYLLMYVPFFIIVGVNGITLLFDRIKRKKE